MGTLLICDECIEANAEPWIEFASYIKNTKDVDIPDYIKNITVRWGGEYLRFELAKKKVLLRYKM